MIDPVNIHHFNLGDELLMRFTDNGVVNNYRVWVTGLDVPPAPPPPGGGGGGAPPVYLASSYIGCNGNVPVIEPRAIYPSGNISAPWTPLNTGHNKVYFKVLRSGRRNQLNSAIQNTVIAGTYAPANFAELFSHAAITSSTLSASLTTFKDGITTQDEFQFATPYHFNDFILGKKGNYRESASYGWLTKRKYNALNTPAHARRDGLFETYANLWQLGIYTSDGGSCSFNDYAIKLPDNVPSAWKLLKFVDQYSAYGLPLEEIDAAGIHSAALYGYNHSLPVAVGSNMTNRSLKYLNFEDLVVPRNVNQNTLGIWESLSNITASTSKSYLGKNYAIPTATGFGPYASNFSSVTSSFSHTGKYSILFTTAGKIRLAVKEDYTSVPYAYVSIWVKPPSGLPSTTQILIQGKGVAGDDNASQNFTAFTRKTNAIDGWYKLEGKIDMSVLSAYNDFYLVMPVNYYLDDVRLYPDNGNMKSFAYDASNMRLMAELDENNFATLYEYDQEGVLVRVKKESDRGILTVNEHRKANAKQIQ
jgi:hypothetical protein